MESIQVVIAALLFAAIATLLTACGTFTACDYEGTMMRPNSKSFYAEECRKERALKQIESGALR